MKKRLLMILLLAFVSLYSGCDEQSKPDDFICVMLPEQDGLNIISQNPLYIKSGEDAIFEVTLSEKYRIAELDEKAVFDGTSITLSEIRYPHTVEITTAEQREYSFTFNNDIFYGKVESTAANGYYLEGTEITIQTTPNNGKNFHCYSLGDTVQNGGTILTLDPEYTFVIDSDMDVYVNYTATPVTMLTYHANGGTVNGKESINVYFEDEFWLCPNTPISDGSFEREGYVLLGFSSEKDGGKYYGTGWNVPVTDTEMEFWAVWAEETPVSCFTYEIKDGKAAIKSYTGDYETVVIPETIEGCPVTNISPRAFKNCSFHTLVLGRNITGVQVNAFSGCTSFETLYITDNVTAIPGTAFGDTHIKKLYINAARLPVFSYELMGMGSVKFERLLLTESPKLVVVSGSSSLFGLQTPLLESLLNNQYTVINYGNHCGTPSVFFMELASSFLTEGDIILTAPEPTSSQWGGTTFTVTLWQIFEVAYDAFSYVDISRYSDVLTSFAAYNQICSQLSEKGYDYHMEYYSNNGDYDLPRPNAMKNYLAGSANSNDLSTYHQTEYGITAYNEIADLLADRGIHVLMSYSPVNRNSLTFASNTESYQKSYETRARVRYHADLISEVEDYIMDGTYFFDTDLHLTTEGAEIRTKKLAEDILAWQGTEGVTP